MKNKRVFISGGAGVIGNELVMKLHQLGAVVFVGDLKSKPLYWPKDILYRQGDLNFLAEREMESFQPDIFFHLAATFERSAETYEFWAENFHHNTILSNHLMTLMKNITSLKRVVFASSYLIYNPELYQFSVPQKAARRLREDDPIYPRNLTGVAKLYHEIELRFLSNFPQVPFTSVCARIFRGYGKNSKDVISRWVRSLLKGEEITVYKKEGMFDYIYSEDVAEGLIKLALNNDITGLINLGNDNARRVEEVVQILTKYFPEMKINESDSDILYEASQANMDLFVKKVGWKPTRQLEDTIPQIIEFEKQNKNKTESIISSNLLITSISKKIPLIKAVRAAANKINTSIKIIGGDGNNNCIGKYFVDDFWHMPLTIEENKKIIIEYLIKNNIKAIIPTRDGELSFWADLKDRLKEINIMVSSKKAVENCIDKLIFFETLKEPFPVIQTSLSLNEIKSDSFVVKEQFGAGSANIGIDLNKQEALLHAEKMRSPIFQPYIKGKEYSVDLYLQKNGKAKGAIVRSRDVIVNGESQITTTSDNTTLAEMSIKLAEKLGLYGHIVLQVMEQDNKYFIIECNSRFGGASTLSVNSGLDSFYWFLLESFGEDISEYPFLPSKESIKQIRFPEDIIVGKIN